jgi:hypothetical protein
LGEFFFFKKPPKSSFSLKFSREKIGLGDYLWTLGDFFTKTSGHPDFG